MNKKSKETLLLGVAIFSLIALLCHIPFNLEKQATSARTLSLNEIITKLPINKAGGNY